MKLLGKLVCMGLFLFLLSTAPAFAQFEVNPDHFNDITNQTPPQAAVALKRKTAPQHPGTGAAAAQPSHARKSQAQPARTSSSAKEQVASVQRHGHARKASLSAKSVLQGPAAASGNSGSPSRAGMTFR
jgi:hypothetical protein